MARPWETLDRVSTDEGELELRRRGDEFLITVDGRVLMSSADHRSEDLLSEAAVAAMTALGGRGVGEPRILVGGLGMGYTLRALLDALPRGSKAQVTVAEITPAVVDWCRGPLAEATDGAVADPRVTVEIADVAQVIARAAQRGGDGRWDAIILDLYEGPREAHAAEGRAFYGRRALDTTRKALAPGGVFAVWSEEPDRPFERRLKQAGFQVERRVPETGRRRHAVYVGR
jgi:spermidine synthase